MVEFELEFQNGHSGKDVGYRLSEKLQEFYGKDFVTGGFSIGNVFTAFKVHRDGYNGSYSYASVVFSLEGERGTYMEEPRKKFLLDMPADGSKREFYESKFVAPLKKMFK